jgi:hypothetical protein
MNASNPPSDTKWQQMLAIVNQNAGSVLPDLKKEFYQLFLKRLFAENALIFLLQYIGLVLCAFGTNATPVWLAAGTSVAFVFMRGLSVLPGMWLGTYCAYYFAHAGISVALTTATIYALQAYLLLTLSYRFISPTLIYYRQILLAKFFILSGLITAFSSAACILICYKTFSSPAWLNWWLANLTGVLIFSFALMTLDAFFTQVEDLKKLSQRSLLFYSLVIIVPMLGLIVSVHPFMIITMSMLLLFGVSLTGWRFGWCGSVISIFCIGFGLDLTAFLQTPLFNTAFSFQTVIYIQLLLLLETIIGLSLGIQKLSGD